MHFLIPHEIHAVILLLLHKTRNRDVNMRRKSNVFFLFHLSPPKPSYVCGLRDVHMYVNHFTIKKLHLNYAVT